MKSFLLHRIITVNSDNKSLVLSKIQNDPSLKGAYFISLFRAYYLNSIRNKEFLLNIGKEVIMSIPEVIYTQKYFYLLDGLSDKIDDLKASGLIELWHSQCNERVFQNNNDDNNPKVLTLHDFKGSFQILLCGFLISFAVFLLEVVINFKRFLFALNIKM